MTVSRKIWSVLNKIRHQRSLTSRTLPIPFEFIDGFFGADCVDADDERRIIRKLDDEKVIKIIAPVETQDYVTNTDPLAGTHTAQIQLLKKFWASYIWYFLINIPENIFRGLKVKNPPYILLAIVGIALLLFLGFKFTGVQIGPLSFAPPDNRNASNQFSERGLNPEIKSCILDQVSRFKPELITFKVFGSFETYKSDSAGGMFGKPPDNETISFAKEVAVF